MRNEFLRELVKNYAVDGKVFSNMEDDIIGASELLAEKMENKNKIVFVCVGSSSDIVKGLKHDLVYNFGFDEDFMIVINAGHKYRNEIENWREVGALSSVATIDLMELNLSENDLVIAVTSSAETEYVMGALSYSIDSGVDTILITNNHKVNIELKPKIILSIPFEHNVMGIRSFEGTTLMKMVLDLVLYNSLQEAGRIYKGYPIYMKWNSDRSRLEVMKVICRITDKSLPEAEEALLECGGEVATTVVTLIDGITKEAARDKIFNARQNFNKIWK